MVRDFLFRARWIPNQHSLSSVGVFSFVKGLGIDRSRKNIINSLDAGN